MESAILLAVPEAELLVGDLRRQGDLSASLGVPAHVTLLYPFVQEPDPGVIEELRFFFAHVDAFPLEFSSIGEFPEVVYLAPDRADELSGLIDALSRRWPDHPPYGGAFDEVVPHLTVVDTPDEALRARARQQVAAGLPVRSTASEASLWVHEEGARWACLARFPLAPAESD